jgi:hypothetical protein
MNLQKRIEKIIVTVLTFLGCGMLTSCYGCMPGDFVLSGTVTSDGTSAIKGVSVSCAKDGSDTETTTTDENGYYEFAINADCISGTLTFTDTDGADNGGSFKSQTKKFTTDETNFDVTLEKDE